MKKLQKGFTLIELLVVIAIIGILAGIVLVNVSQARNRARESAIISALSQIRSDKELNFDTSPVGYKATTGQILTTISNNSGVLNESNTDTTYRSSSSLPTGGFYCVDSTGASRKTTTSPTGTSCP